MIGQLPFAVFVQGGTSPLLDATITFVINDRFIVAVN